MSVSVCLYAHISEKHSSKLHKIFCTCYRCLVLLSQHCNTLSTSCLPAVLYDAWLRGCIVKVTEQEKHRFDTTANRPAAYDQSDSPGG